MDLSVVDESSGPCSSSTTTDWALNSKNSSSSTMPNFEVPGRGLPPSIDAETVPPNNATKSSSLLRLPYEVRSMIFWLTVNHPESPTPKQIHQQNLPAVWKDRPSPLLGTSTQTRDEMKDLLRRKARQRFRLRVTTFGLAFDMFSLSLLIAMDLPKQYGSSLLALPYMFQDLPQNHRAQPELMIQIWPTSNNYDRKVEILHLDRQLRKLRKILCSAPQNFPKISIWFKESKCSKWVDEDDEPGEPYASLYYFQDDCFGDINILVALSHFEYVTNVNSVYIRLPPSLAKDDFVRQHAASVVRRMEKRSQEGDDDCFINDLTEEESRSEEKSLMKRLERPNFYPYDYHSMYQAWYGKERDAPESRNNIRDFAKSNHNHFRGILGLEFSDLSFLEDGYF